MINRVKRTHLLYYMPEMLDIFLRLLYNYYIANTFEVIPMAEKRGGISVDAEHIFPVIKKWLYSDKEIFLREIVSNACDAVTKLRRLISLGDDIARNIPDEGFRVDVELDTDARTLTVSDNGIGMTSEEVEKYICQIALSGALEFIEKYEGESGDNGIIGHFGLGFYSAFMVSSTVEVITRSYKGGEAVKWVCSEDGSYEMSSIDYDEAPERGTTIVMHINEEGEEYLNKSKLTEILDKYCAFMPVDIYLHDGTETASESTVNDTEPLWLKNPSECTDDEYKAFYKKVFRDYKDPLFWIHIKADYPLNFKGILYFPKISSEFESLESQVKLYYNQVFVADNIKEVVPEYFLTIRGILDCPELPLNVSRSYLQNSTYVTKISSHIVKKVADRLNMLFSKDRDAYSTLWNDIKTFVEYACMRDKKFYDRVKNSILFELCDGKSATLAEYLEKAKDNHENKVYYASDKNLQSRYISIFAKEEIDVVLLEKMIDTQFAQMIETYEEGVHFARIDSELPDSMKGDDASEPEGVVDIFRAVIPEKTKIRFESFKDPTVPALLNVSEDSRRMEDMMKMYMAMGNGMNSVPGADEELVLNANSPIITGLSASSNKEMIAKQIYSLCLLSHRQLTPGELSAFLTDSYDILSQL